MVTRTWAIDVAERAIMTAAQAFLAVWVVTDTSTTRAAAVAALAAALSVLKGAIATKVGDNTTAALLPSSTGS